MSGELPFSALETYLASVPGISPRFVRGMEVQPGNTHIVHHITIGVDETSGSRELDRDDPKPGFDGAMFAEGAHSPDNHALGWTPGMIRQLTLAIASCGSAFTAWPPSSIVATQVVRSCAL